MLKRQQVTPEIPIISSILDVSSSKSQPNLQDMFFMIKFIKPQCKCDTSTTPACELIKKFGRLWVQTMLSNYAVLLSTEATTESHSLRSFALNQLLNIKKFSEEKRLKLQEVFDKAMRLPDLDDKQNKTLLGPKLKKLLYLSSKIQASTTDASYSAEFSRQNKGHSNEFFNRLSGQQVGQNSS